MEEGAVVRYSIIMPGAKVEKGAIVEYAIVAENAVIGAGAHVGGEKSDAPEWGIAVVAQNLKVGEGAVVAPNAMVTRNVKGVKA